MKILHLSKMDSGGGAADGFVRIHRALLEQGHESVAYVIKQKRSDVPGLIDARGLLGPLEGLIWGFGRLWAKLLRLYLKPSGVYDLDAEANFPAEPIIKDARARAEKWDLVLVHWSGGFVRPETIRDISVALGSRVALWQVDMAHATGGCHYPPVECSNYTSGCGRCPLILSQDKADISARQAATRQKVWGSLGALVLAPSSWSRSNAQKSAVLKELTVHTFPIPLDLGILNAKGDQLEARRRLGLPADRRILLVRALSPSIPYKSFGLFQAAIKELDAQGASFHILAIGESGHLPAGLKNITFTDIGPVKGDLALADVYRACDFFVSCSIQDAGPMMIGEAMACGRPALAYPIGIAPDLIDSRRNGTIVVPVGDVASLAAAINAYVGMPPAELAACQKAAADSAGRVFSASSFAEQVQSVLCR